MNKIIILATVLIGMVCLFDTPLSRAEMSISGLKVWNLEDLAYQTSLIASTDGTLATHQKCNIMVGGKGIDAGHFFLLRHDLLDPSLGSGFFLCTEVGGKHERIK